MRQLYSRFQEYMKKRNVDLINTTQCCLVFRVFFPQYKADKTNLDVYLHLLISSGKEGGRIPETSNSDSYHLGLKHYF